MMACCIIAAYLYAQLVGVLRRWCIFWGLARRRAGESDVPILMDSLRGRARPAASTVALTLVLIGTAGIVAMGGDERGAGAGPHVPRVSDILRLRP